MLTLVADGGREKRRQVPGMIGSPVYIPLSIMTQGGRIFPGKGTTTEDALPVCVEGLGIAVLSVIIYWSVQTCTLRCPRKYADTQRTLPTPSVIEPQYLAHRAPKHPIGIKPLPDLVEPPQMLPSRAVSPHPHHNCQKEDLHRDPSS